MYRRNTYNILMERLREPRKFIQVLMGPRQVGKTTVIHQVLSDIEIPGRLFNADAVLEDQQTWISSCWQQARLEIKLHGLKEYLIVFDEIQKISHWSEYIKKEWDNDSYQGIPVKVVLLGSSRVMLEKGLADSMAGRFETIRIGHWSYPEMRDAFGFSLEQYIYFGGYPGSASLIQDEQRWKDYIRSSMIETALQRDILIQTPISKPALLRQTFELGSAYSGKLLSLTKMLGVLQDAGNTVTLAGYLDLLKESCLLTGLQKYSVDLSRKRASIPKYQVYNNALMNVFHDYTFQKAIENREHWGHIFESSMGSHIVNESYIYGYKVFYWRDGADEVDFIIQANQRMMAIEVKSNQKRMTKGLQKFREIFHPDQTLIIGENGIKPEDFLSVHPFELMQ